MCLYSILVWLLIGTVEDGCAQSGEDRRPSATD